MEKSRKPVCLITGGSRGIGRASAVLAAQKGYSIAVGYRNDSAAAERVVKEISELGGDAVALQADITNPSEIVRLFDEVDHSLGSLTALVNSAGLGMAKCKVIELESDVVSELLAVNVVGVIIACREAVRRMSRRLGGAGGVIVNVSSMASTIGGRPGSTVYAASKAAVDAFTVGLAKEVASEGVRVNVVRPGATITDMTSKLSSNPEAKLALEETIPMGRMGHPEEIAEAIVWLLSEKASWITGAHLDVGGGGFIVGPSI